MHTVSDIYTTTALAILHLLNMQFRKKKNPYIYDKDQIIDYSLESL